jgi:hypothetical protein
VIVYENLNRKLQRGNTGRKRNRSADTAREYIKEKQKAGSEFVFFTSPAGHDSAA